MAVETLREAYSLGWRVTVRCAWGPRDGMKCVRECVYGADLDVIDSTQNRNVAAHAHPVALGAQQAG